MKRSIKQTLTIVIIIYFLIYLILHITANQILLSAMKPGATLLAFLIIRSFPKDRMKNMKMFRVLYITLLYWVLIDVAFAAFEINILTTDMNPEFFHFMQSIFYLVTRVGLLLFVVVIYRKLTLHLNRFQIFSDSLTITLCDFCLGWLTFFDGEVDDLVGGNFALLHQLNPQTIMSLIYLMLSLSLLGYCMLSWFYMRTRRLSIGHTIAFSGLSLIAFYDVILSLNNSLVTSPYTDILLRLAILMMAVGGLYSAKYPDRKDKERSSDEFLVKDIVINSLTLLSYPIFTTIIIGLRISTVCFFPLIAFYVSACLYLRQLAITKRLLENSRINNHELANQSLFTTQLLNTIPSAIYYTTVDDHFLGCNSSFASIHGFLPQEYINSALPEIPLFTEEHRNLYMDMKAVVLQSGAPCIRQITHMSSSNKARTMLYSLSSYLRTDQTVGGFLGVLTDITDLKQKEAELGIALKQANAAAEAKSNFLANMSHEIRTPMNAILGMSYLIQRTSLNSKQMDYILKIHGAASSLLGIINDILDFSKIESGRLELEIAEFNLDIVVTNSMNLLVQKAQEKNIEFLYHAPFEMPHILKGDSLRLGQVLTNLLSNAVKFTEKGSITVDIRELSRENDRIQLCFSVKDTGIGIKSGDTSYLFESFSQSDNSTTRKYGGTGLGLAISKRLVEMMEGTIRVESEYLKGSNFIFTAWFTYDKEQHTKESTKLMNIKDMRVLIVDDSSSSREILQEYLQSMGFATDTAASGEDAVYRLLKYDRSTPYDFVFIDWQMSDLNGVETIRKLHSINLLEHFPYVIMITAYDKDEMVQQAFDIHVDAFLTKPVSQSTLHNTILQLMSHKKIPVETVDFSENDYGLNGLSVLLVEDNEVNQQIAIELLNGQGVKVFTAYNGQEAVDLVLSTECVSDFDIILMDLQMPVLDGFAATQQIRAKFPDLPIIAMTARTLEGEREKCFACGMNDHISKPIDPKALFMTLKKWQKNSRLTPVLPKSEITTDSLDSITIPGLDTKAGLSRVAGSLSVYLHLLQMFLDNDKDTAKKIRELTNHQDYKQAAQLAHKLCGVSGNLGADHLFRICKNFEQEAEYQDSDTLMTLLAQMDKESDFVFQSIKDALTANKISSETEAKNIVSGTIWQLITLLDSGDSDAVSYYQGMKESLKEQLSQTQQKTLEQFIMNYEFDDAVNFLKDLS